MNGLLYKNLRQNRLYVILAFCVPLLFPVYCLLIFLTGSESIAECAASLNDASILRMFFASLIMLINGMAITNTIACDETKKWAFFITSTPKGAKGQVRSRYFIIALLIAITVGMVVLFELLSGLFAMLAADEEPKLNVKLIIELGFILLFINALELPFLFRFGSKRGGLIKSIMFFGLLFVFIVYILFGPLPENGDAVTDAIFGFIDDVRAGNTPTWLKVTGAVFPVVSMILFFLSAKLSCFFYIKGTDNYEK